MDEKPTPVEPTKQDHDEVAPGWPENNMLEAAWGLLANAWEGDWSQAPKDWQKAVRRWRDAYHAQLDQTWLGSHDVAIDQSGVYAWCMPGMHRSATPTGLHPEDQQVLPVGWRKIRATKRRHIPSGEDRWFEDPDSLVQIVVCPEHDPVRMLP
jgi:hypothetical protein